MSHFGIVVVGDVDFNMAPFHEYECDGVNDEFIQDIDQTEELRKTYEERKKTDKEVAGKTFLEFILYWEGSKPVLKSESEIDTETEEQQWGYILVDKNNEVIKVIRRTNPNSFYDYYGKGYSAFLLKKRGANGEWVYTDHAQKKDIDFKSMFEERISNAKKCYRLALSLLGYKDGKYPTLEHTWSSLVDKFYPDEGEATMTRDEAIAIYDAQELVKKWEAIDRETKIANFGFFTKVDDFCMSEDEYVASQHIHALSFGWVQDREYHSRGDMGWWACVSNEKEATSWDKEYEDFLNSLPDDAELTMLDCHV